MAETGESDTWFLIGLSTLHGIAINKDADPMLYCTQDTLQMALFAEEGVLNPTLLQIAFTAKVWALSEEDAHAKMQALLKKMQEPEPDFQ